jgi:hypothetical protein
LPRLLVLSDVSVERTAGGALVLYRLLNQYPRGQLLVASYPTSNWNQPIERVVGADYLPPLTYRIPRVIWNRFNPFWPLLMAQYIRLRAGRIATQVRAHRPEAVLTVAHDYLWFVADAVARQFRIPLHVIFHDDWPSLQTLCQSPRMRPYVRRGCESLVGWVSRRAQTRLCVSPGMAEQYSKRYGFGFQVLYPSRGTDSPVAKVRVRAEPGPPIVAFAGLIHQAWTADRLRVLAAALGPMGGRLDPYVPYSADRLAEWGLQGPQVRRVGFFPASEMCERVAAAAHVLFLPASFGERERVDVATLFPSKLADYTAIGLPILVWGPPYSSAARWAAENPGAAIRVTDDDVCPVRDAAVQLATDTAFAARIAAAGVEAGQRDFDAEGVRRRFLDALVASEHS